LGLSDHALIADLVQRLRSFDLRDVGAIYDTDKLSLLIGEAADALEYLNDDARGHACGHTERLVTWRTVIDLREAAEEIKRLRGDVELLRKGLEFEKRINPNNRPEVVVDPCMPPDQMDIVGAHETITIRDIGHETITRASDDGRDASNPAGTASAASAAPLPQGTDNPGAADAADR
jgi:hypothetical protein